MPAKGYENIPEDEFERWLTPAEALLEMAPLDREAAAIQIQEAARSDLVETAAETISREPRKGSATTVAKFAVIPFFYWGHLSDAAKKLSFWETGLARMWFSSEAGFAAPTTFRCFNVRFKPDDVRKLKPKTPRQFGTQSPPAPISDAKDAPDARKPVSGDHLHAWAELFLKVYGDDYTVKVSDASAQGMFPDKAVGRDRARDMLKAVRGTGPRTTGRKRNKID